MRRTPSYLERGEGTHKNLKGRIAKPNLVSPCTRTHTNIWGRIRSSRRISSSSRRVRAGLRFVRRSLTPFPTGCHISRVPLWRPCRKSSCGGASASRVPSSASRCSDRPCEATCSVSSTTRPSVSASGSHAAHDAWHELSSPARRRAHTALHCGLFVCTQIISSCRR